MEPRFVRIAIERGNGVVCPHYKMDPVKYKHHRECCPSQSKKPWNLAKVSEHLWRCHAPRFICLYCGFRCPSHARGKAAREVREHIEVCERRMELGNKPRCRGADEIDIMTEAQQEALEAARRRRDPETKLVMLYSAVGFGERLPDTFHEFPTTVGILETPILLPISEQQQHNGHHEWAPLEAHSEEAPTAPAQQTLAAPTPPPMPLSEQDIDEHVFWHREYYEGNGSHEPYPTFPLEFEDDNNNEYNVNSNPNDHYHSFIADDQGPEAVGGMGRTNRLLEGFAPPDRAEAGDMSVPPSRTPTMSQIAAWTVSDVYDVPSAANPPTLDDRTTLFAPTTITTAGSDVEGGGGGRGQGNEEEELLLLRNLDHIYLPAVPQGSGDVGDALLLWDSSAADLLKGTAAPKLDMQGDWTRPVELNDEEDGLYGGSDSSM